MLRKIFIIIFILFALVEARAQSKQVYRGFNPASDTCNDAIGVIIVQSNQNLPSANQWYKCVNNAYVLVDDWSVWTPTYSSNLGNAAATFSGGVVTTEVTRYNQIGKTLFLNVAFRGTLNVVTPNYIEFTLPGNAQPEATNQTVSAAEIGDNSVTGNGWVQFFSGATSTGRCFKSNSATNFTSATVVSCRFTAVISVQ